MGCIHWGYHRLISHATREVRSRITTFIELLRLCAAIKVARSAQNPEIAVLVYPSARISSSLCLLLRSPFSVSLSNLSYLLCEWCSCCRYSTPPLTIGNGIGCGLFLCFHFSQGYYHIRKCYLTHSPVNHETGP